MTEEDKMLRKGNDVRDLTRREFGRWAMAIGIDIPWYVPGGMEPRPSDRDVLQQVVRRAFDAGADGVLASREYNEMRLSHLEAFGKAVRNG